MKIPVRRLPQTNVSQQQQGFARAVPGLDISQIAKPVTEIVTGLRDQMLDEQRDRQKFEINKRVLNEVNELSADFEARRRDPKVSPLNFADSSKADYEVRHKAITDELYGEGYDDDLVQDLELRLGAVRQTLYEKSLGHQLSALTDRAFQQADDFGREASRYVATNPDGYKSAVDMVRMTISSMPDLTEAQKEAKIDEQLGILRDAGAKALAMQNPQFIIDKLDPEGFTAPYRPATATTATGGTITAPADSWQGVATTVASELGLDPTEVAAVMSYETAGTFSPTIMGGKNGNYMGLIQFGREERKKYGITQASTPEEWSAAILSFMKGRGFKKGMGLLDFYSTINAGSPGRYGASDGPGNTVKGHVRKLLKEHKGKASKWLASVMPAPAAETVPTTTPALAPTAEVPKERRDAATGNALLDDLNGPERLQALGWAREQLNKVNASRKAEMDVAIGNITAEALNNGGEIATPIPAEADVLAVYGPVEGPQRWAQIQQSKDTGKAITTFRTRSAADIQAGLDAIEPTPGSPTYQTELQIYEAAERAAQHLLSERQSDPAAYALKYFPSVAEAAKRSPAQYYAEIDRVYETLGIDSSRAPLLSADVARQMTQDYKLMSPPQKLAFMRDNYRGMGEERFRRFVSNMEGTTAQDDARIFALFRSYPATGAGDVATVYQQVLEGRDIMAQDPARRPTADEFNKQFRKPEILSAFRLLNADASRAIQEAAAALYVVKGGKPDKIDSDIYEESLSMALGGNLPVNMGKGQAKDFTILPPRVNRTQFQNWIEDQTFQSITEASVDKRPPRYGDLKTPVPMNDILDDGVFVMVSPGRYMIKMASDGRPLMTSKGHPFLVNINANTVSKRVRKVPIGAVTADRSGW